jgi:hypothetical protein
VLMEQKQKINCKNWLTMNNNEDELIKNLILEGALEVAGLDAETGEFLYAVTSKMKEIMPDMYEDHLKTVNRDLLNLWEKGYVNIDFFLPDPVVTISEKGIDKAEISKLTKPEIWALEEVKRLLQR